MKLRTGNTNRPGGYCVTLVYPIPLLPSGPGGVFGLQLRSPPKPFGSGCPLKRREWDSNPRWSYPHTRFPSVLLKPLGHLSEGSHCVKTTFRMYHNREIKTERGVNSCSAASRSTI